MKIKSSSFNGSDNMITIKDDVNLPIIDIVYSGLFHSSKYEIKGVDEL